MPRLSQTVVDQLCTRLDKWVTFCHKKARLCERLSNPMSAVYTASVHRLLAAKIAFATTATDEAERDLRRRFLCETHEDPYLGFLVLGQKLDDALLDRISHLKDEEIAGEIDCLMLQAAQDPLADLVKMRAVLEVFFLEYAHVFGAVPSQATIDEQYATFCRN